MSLYTVDCEYDMDLVLGECMKLVVLDGGKVKVAFNSVNMFNLFFENFKERCIAANINPLSTGFHMDILIDKDSILEEDDEGDTSDVG